MLDEKQWIESYDDYQPNVDPQTAYKIIQSTAFTAKELGAKMFGFSKEPNPVAYSGHEPFGVTGFVIGGAMGFFEGFQMKDLPDECVAATDMFISCLNAYYNRFAWYDKRYFLASPEGTFVSTGGMSDFRTVHTEEDDFKLLKAYFGSAIQLKKLNPLRKLQHGWERTLKLSW